MEPSHIVFVPGTFCNHRLFSPQVEYFSKLGISTHVAEIDGGDSIETIAETILLQSPEKFALAGLSMGGIIAFELFRQAPERFTHLALLDTNFLPETEEKASARTEHLLRINASVDSLKTYIEFVADTLFPLYTAAQGDALQQLKNTVIAMAKETSWITGQQQLLALNSRPDSAMTLKEINVPTAIICGEQDQLCPIERHEKMHEAIANATLDILPDCGHLSTLEKPHQVNELLHRWILR